MFVFFGGYRFQPGHVGERPYGIHFGLLIHRQFVHALDRVLEFILSFDNLKHFHAKQERGRHRNSNLSFDRFLN